MSNSTTLVGNLVRPAELKYTPSGGAVANFGLAVNRRWKDRNDEWQEQTSFLNVVCWRELAENVAESLDKGDRVVVSGRLEQRSYETPDGEKRSVVEVVADEVAPSLKWATCTVVRNERKEGGGKPAPAPAYSADEDVF